MGTGWRLNLCPVFFSPSFLVVWTIGLSFFAKLIQFESPCMHIQSTGCTLGTQPETASFMSKSWTSYQKAVSYCNSFLFATWIYKVEGGCGSNLAAP